MVSSIILCVCYIRQNPVGHIGIYIWLHRLPPGIGIFEDLISQIPPLARVGPNIDKPLSDVCAC